MIIDNYGVTFRRGFDILSPPNRTSPFALILWVHPGLGLFLTPFQIRALFWSWLEGEPLFPFINMKFDLSNSDINVHICSAHEGSPKNEWCLHVLLHVKYHKIYRNEEISYFYQNILSDSYRVADRLVG